MGSQVQVGTTWLGRDSCGKRWKMARSAAYRGGDASAVNVAVNVAR